VLHARQKYAFVGKRYRNVSPQFVVFSIPFLLQVLINRRCLLVQEVQLILPQQKRAHPYYRSQQPTFYRHPLETFNPDALVFPTGDGRGKD